MIAGKEREEGRKGVWKRKTREVRGKWRGRTKIKEERVMGNEREGKRMGRDWKKGRKEDRYRRNSEVKEKKRGRETEEGRKKGELKKKTSKGGGAESVRKGKQDERGNLKDVRETKKR